MRLRDLFAALTVAALLAGASMSPPAQRLQGISLDMLFWARHQLFGPRYDPMESPTVVIGVDEATYRREPFAGTPKSLWTPQIGQVLDQAIAAGAKVVGFDIVFPTSVERAMPGYERPYWEFVREAGRRGQLVLGKVQHATDPLLPTRAQMMLVGGERNVHLLNVIADADGVVRSVPLLLEREGGGWETSMAMELTMRANGGHVAPLADGRVSLSGMPIRGSDGRRILINFDGDNAIPTYSLADLHACIEAGDTEYMRKAFAGKVIYFGAVLDLEDRKLTSKRYITGPEGGYRPTPCRLEHPVRHDADLRREDIPGVYAQAAAVNSLLRNDALVRIGPWPSAAIVGFAALIGALLTLPFRPLVGLGVVVATALAWGGVSTAAMQADSVLPLLMPWASVTIGFAAMLGYRFAVSDRQKLRLRHLFGMYLAPAVIEEMLAQDQMPELGGELRQVTVWFSDLADFTTISEGLTPLELVPLINTYFSAITDLIEEHGGFVDKYIGDAVVAVFGAPQQDLQHASHAVAAALRVHERLEQMNRDRAFGDRRFNTRIGLNSGDALVGNIGSSRRFNYTVMGDTVNLASRLEGANKYFGTHLLISETTADLAKGDVSLRDVGRVRVKGRHAPIYIYEPLGLSPPADAEQGRLERFAAAMARFRDGDFQQAEAQFTACAQRADGSTDQTAEIYIDRCRRLTASPPSAWDGISALTDK